MHAHAFDSFSPFDFAIISRNKTPTPRTHKVRRQPAPEDDEDDEDDDDDDDKKVTSRNAPPTPPIHPHFLNEVFLERSTQAISFAAIPRSRVPRGGGGWPF